MPLTSRQSFSLLSLLSCLQVIRALDPKLNPATAEIQSLRNQLADRDKQILNLEVKLPFDLSTLVNDSTMSEPVRKKKSTSFLASV